MLFANGILTPFKSAGAFSGVPLTGNVPTDGQVLKYNSVINQFVYSSGATPPEPNNAYVDLLSNQTITGIKTIDTSLNFGPTATLTKGSSAFILPSDGVAPPPNGGILLDTSYDQIITGIKTIDTSLNFGPTATLTKGNSTFNLPSSSGVIAVQPTGGGTFVDTTTSQTIGGVKTFSETLRFTNTIYIESNNSNASVYIPPIYKTVLTSGGATVLAGNTGILGISSSSKRFKTDIQPLGSCNLDELQVVKYKMNGNDSVGLIAEQVVKVMPELVLTDENDEPFTVKYHELIPYLLLKVQQLERAVTEMAGKPLNPMNHESPETYD